MNSNYLYYTNISCLSDDVYYKFLSKASDIRLKKINSYKNISDKKLSLCSELLLKYAFNDLGIKSDYIFVCNSNNKPYLDDTNVFFNFSHSDDYVICAISYSEIGADIEKIRMINSDIARKCFSISEYEYLSSINDNGKRLNEFFRIWTLKESFIKNIGGGLSIPLCDFSINIVDNVTIRQNINSIEYYFEEFDFDSNYKCSVCKLNKNNTILHNVNVLNLIN